MKRIWAVLITIIAVTAIHAGALSPGRVELLCHRTANEDVPENTLESLEQAALLGCDVVEIDLRKTLDGKIVLNHDGILERLTDGVGETEKTYYEDLRLRDAGSWMGERWSGMRMVLFEDALRLARERDVRLVLDIKTKGIGVDVLEILQREGMLKRVQFNGEWEDVKRLYSGATNAGDGTAWVQPGVTAEQVKVFHNQGKAVVENFSDNEHEMDIDAMRAAVTAGVDGINVDYPRLGADAVGRPVERKLNALEVKAGGGESSMRAGAILELSRYRGFPLKMEFERWLLDADAHVSRAAAVALVTSRPKAPVTAFSAALRSEHADVRANAAWALGAIGAPVTDLLPLLKDKDPLVLQQTLLAISRGSGEVNAEILLPILSQGDLRVRGEAALALAHHEPDIAIRAIPVQLRLEMKEAVRLGDDYVRRGKPKLTQAETDEIMGHFQCQMKMVQAISMLKGAESMQELEELAFRPGKDSAQFDSIVSAFQLWDRIGVNAQPAVEALASPDTGVRDRAEWMLVQGGAAVLPNVRKALDSESSAIRERAIRIVAWQGDRDSLEKLKAMQKTDASNAALAAWAIDKIQSLHPAS